MNSMEVNEVLCMNGGDGDYSYSTNSLLQRKVISMTKPLIKDALENLYYAMNFPKTIIMADLGCSSGPNTLLVASEFVKSIDNIRRKFGHDESPEIQIYLNDLPSNDFNTIFLSVSKVLRNLSSPSCYFCGVPGSFYTRLFLNKSIHFLHSSYSLMWLSQVPEMLDTNKGNIYMSTTSPRSVIRAYQEQFQRDFSMFLKCRAEEMVIGGRMVLTFLGRRSDDPCSKECCYVWDLLAIALNDMVAEELKKVTLLLFSLNLATMTDMKPIRLHYHHQKGILRTPRFGGDPTVGVIRNFKFLLTLIGHYKGIIEEDKMESFNIPQYTPCAKEISDEVEKEDSFIINQLEISEVDWDACTDSELHEDAEGYNMGKCMRAVAEPLVLSHFGESIIEELFMRYTDIIMNRMSIEKTKLVNVTVSMTRRG